MTRDEIVKGVCKCIGEVVYTDPATIKEKDKIIEDLGADSLDLLDLIFRLERHFKISISPGDIERKAKSKLGDVPLQINGIYTPKALEELRKALPEVPHAELSEGLHMAKLPRTFRVATFVNIVSRIQAESSSEKAHG
ncbi:MAG: phosphopantetheine-binding protein [Elusimicrobiota bacterium]|jgi:acyl carrier protein